MKKSTKMLSALALTVFGMMCSNNTSYASSELQDVIADQTKSSYDITVDTKIDESLGALKGENRNLTINGNFKTVDGNLKQGITVSEGQSLSLKNLNLTRFNYPAYYDGGAINNTNGTINISVENGSSTYNGLFATKGGAIYSTGSNAVINVIAQNNGTLTFADCLSYEYKGGFGGAIYNENGTLNVSANGGNIIFDYNETSSGGGALCNKGGNLNLSAQNGSVSFTNNIADSNGGAIYSDGTLDKNITANENGVLNFSKNEAKNAGAIYYNGGAKTNSSIFNITANRGTINFEENTAYTSGGAIQNTSAGAKMVLTAVNNGSVRFSKNTAQSGKGGAISNNTCSFDIVADNGNILFEENSSKTDGGAISSTGNVVVSADNQGNIAFKGNSSKNGGAIYNSMKNKTMDIVAKNGANVLFENNTATDNGGAINNNKGTLTLLADNGTITFDGNTAASGGAIYNTNTNANSFNINVENNGLVLFKTASDTIYNDYELTISSTDNTGNVEMNGELTGAKGTLSINGANVVANANISQKTIDIADNGKLTNNAELTATKITNGGMMNINGIVNGQLINSENGTINLLTNSLQNLTINGGNLNLVNGLTETVTFDKLNVNGSFNLGLDANLRDAQIDNILVSDVANSSVSDGSKITINNLNLLSDVNGNDFELNIFADEATKNLLSDKVEFGVKDLTYSPIFVYETTYDAQKGAITFTKSSSGNGFNPAVKVASVGEQVGAYLTQIQVYDKALANFDSLMAMPKDVRNAMKFQNKYASLQGTDNGVITYNPNQLPEQNKGVWLRPFVSFENVDLKNGPDVSNVSYGTLVGGDTGIIDLKKDWSAVYSVYSGYNGSHQAYDGIGIYQNGGLLGLSGVWYKNNFFTGLTANVGASAGRAETMYGNEDFTMLSTGIASKTGYNFELADGKFIIQPSYLMSYSFVNTFDYTNSAGVKISTDPLNAIQIVPGVKFIGNLKNGWQPYVGVQMVWNVMDRSKIKANDVRLPEMSVKPYVQYGVGLQKRWANKFTAFGEAMIRNGGRNGISLNFGFRWAIGKDK